MIVFFILKNNLKEKNITYNKNISRGFLFAFLSVICAVLAATLALGTAIISLIGALGAALTLGSRRSGVLLSVFVLPLLVPVLIFGVGTVEATIQGYAVTQPFLILTAIFLICLVSCPWSCSRVLRSAID